jgi:hydrogenase expression/formation protein HypE
MAGETIQLDHGARGGASGEAIAELIASRLGVAAGPGAVGGVRARWPGGGGRLELEAGEIALAGGAFAVDPIFFDGGDIGALAVCGTVNELAACGALARYLTLSLTIEQGLPVADLARVLDSVRAAAEAADVEVVAGDTRVVRRGEADKLFVHTAGVGEFAQRVELSAERLRPGDAVIATGALGAHGLQILARREGLACAGEQPSDCAPLGGLVWNLLEDYAPQVRCMRELLRGGLANVLSELADGAGVSIELDAHRLPVGREARAVAARLGVDPLYLPSAGSICIVVDGAAAAAVLELVRWQPQGRDARLVGTVRERGPGAVTMAAPDGGEAQALARFADMELTRLR